MKNSEIKEVLIDIRDDRSGNEVLLEWISDNLK